MTQPAPSRQGNAFIYYVAIILVAAFVVGGLFYLIPDIYHPFSSDTPTVHYAHWKASLAFFGAAIIGLFIVRFSRPNTTQ